LFRQAKLTDPQLAFVTPLLVVLGLTEGVKYCLACFAEIGVSRRQLGPIFKGSHANLKDISVHFLSENLGMLILFGFGGGMLGFVGWLARHLIATTVKVVLKVILVDVFV